MSTILSWVIRSAAKVAEEFAHHYKLARSARSSSSAEPLSAPAEEDDGACADRLIARIQLFQTLEQGLNNGRAPVRGQS